MTTLLVIRHGPTPWTRIKRLQGRRDIPLSGEGREMVRSWRLAEWTAAARWVTSPLARARQTAALLGASGAVVEPRVIEADWGRWEGETMTGLRRRLGQAMAANEARGLDFRPDGGESPREVVERLRGWLEDLAATREPVVAVTHKGVIRALMAMATGWDMTGKPPQKIRWGIAHQFRLADGARLTMGDPVDTTAPMIDT